jgi:uncharacterized lipoprotein YajG
MRYGQPRLLTVALATAMMGGCASVDTHVDELRGMLSAEKEQSSVLKSAVVSLESKLANSNRMVGSKNEQLGEHEKQLEMAKMSPDAALLPPWGQNGRVLCPRLYRAEV